MKAISDPFRETFALPAELRAVARTIGLEPMTQSWITETNDPKFTKARLIKEDRQIRDDLGVVLSHLRTKEGNRNQRPGDPL